MSSFQLDLQCPLSPTPTPLKDLMSSDDGATLDAAKLKALIRQALQLFRAGETDFTKGKVYHLEHDSHVQTSKGKAPANEPSARNRQCGWHARRSLHDADKHVNKLAYADFYDGLFVDHPIKERQYIHDIIRYERVGGTDSVRAPRSSEIAQGGAISDVRADVWITEYKLPALTSNRDFVELFLTVEFAPVADPLSKSHIDKLIAAMDAQSQNDTSTTVAEAEPNSSSAAAAGELRKSCINIQYPVTTNEATPNPKFVRASYASVEAIRQVDSAERQTEWWMAVQSDSAGMVPLIFQELAMPSKISPDVSCFIGWAVKQKTSSTSAADASS